MGKLRTVRDAVPMAAGLGAKLATAATPRTRGSARMAMRARVFARDGGMCQQCLRKGRFTACLPSDPVDHIVPLHLGGKEDDERGQELLCRSCHDLKTAVEARFRAGKT